MSANNPERSYCTVTKTPKHQQSLSSNHLSSNHVIGKNPSAHPLQNPLPIMPFKISHIRQLGLLITQQPGATCSSLHLSLSQPPVSSSMKFHNCSFVCAAPSLWGGLLKDLHQSAHSLIPPSQISLHIFVKFTFFA